MLPIMRRVPTLFLLALAATLAVSGGCARKKPVTPADTPPPAIEPASSGPATTEVTESNPQTTDPVEDPLSGDLASLNEYLRRQGLLGDVYFDYDRAELRGPERDGIARNADFLRSQPRFVLTIEGHCDERGTNEYNLALGERRANAVRDYMVSLGVAADRLRTISYGEERPVCTDSDESCRRQNRRAHHVVTGRQD
jgi:peptidoglycan-associated lipoprotein